MAAKPIPAYQGNSAATSNTNPSAPPSFFRAIFSPYFDVLFSHRWKKADKRKPSDLKAGFEKPLQAPRSGR
jgi:hypothetical protein